MTIGPLSSLYSSLLQPVASALGISKNSGSTSATGSVSQTPDNPDLSPAARMLKMLQQLQQEDPNKFKQLTADIASHLKTEAAQATAAGNATEASKLTSLAAVFQNASSTGQVPNAQSLQQAGLGTGAHHHHHHGGGANPFASSQATSDSSSTLDQVASMFASMMGNSVSGA
jgi:hypothetical protein